MAGMNEQLPLQMEVMAESDEEAGQTLEEMHELLKYNKILMQKYSKLMKEQGNDVEMINLEEQIKELENLPQNLKIVTEKIKTSIENIEKKPSANAVFARTVVRLTSETNNDEIVVHTDPERRIPEERVKALFCDITAIKFKPNEDSSFWRMLLHEDGFFHPPEDGWKDRNYLCIKPKNIEPKEDEFEDTEIIQQIPKYQQWIMPVMDSPEVQISLQNYNLQLQQQMLLCSQQTNIWQPGTIQNTRENCQQILGHPMFSFSP